MLTGATFFGSIKRQFKLKDKEGKERNIYGGGTVELVTRDLDGKLRIVLGPNAGKEVNKGYVQAFSIAAAMQITEKVDINDVLKDMNVMCKDIFFELVDGKPVEITDDDLLIQIDEILKKENNRPQLAEHVEEKESKLPKIGDLYNKITSNVICQDEQVRAVLSSVYNNALLSEMDLSDEKISKLKQNVLISGSTGTGKTEIIRQIANLFKLPMVVEDATRFTEAGYVGADIDDVFVHLIKQAEELGGGQELAERGILVFDEFDKLANSNPDGNDVGKTSVQQSLLTMLEGGERQIEIGAGGQKRHLKFNTSRLTVIGLGAFAGIEKLKNTKVALTKPIGFNSAVVYTAPKEIKNTEKYAIEDYIKYGMMAELLGRFSQIVQMNELDESALKEILLKSKLSFLRLKEEFYKCRGIELKYDDEFINEVCKKAAEFGCGARSLNTILNEIFSNGQFESFDGKYQTFELTKETVENPKKYVLK